MGLSSLTNSLFAKLVTWGAITASTMIGLPARAAVPETGISVTFAWDRNADPSYMYPYGIQKNGGAWSGGVVLPEQCSQTTCTKQFTHLDPSSVYRFRVAAHDGERMSNWTPGPEGMQYVTGAIAMHDISPPILSIDTIAYEGDIARVTISAIEDSHFTMKRAGEGSVLAHNFTTFTDAVFVPAGTERSIAYVATDIHGNVGTVSATLRQVPGTFDAGYDGTIQTSGDAIGTSVAMVAGAFLRSLDANSSASSSSTAAYTIPLRVLQASSPYQSSDERIGIDLLAMNRGRERTMRMTLSDHQANQVSYLLALPDDGQLRRIIVPLEFPACGDQYAAFDFSAMRDEVKLELLDVSGAINAASSDSVLIHSLAVRELGVIGSGRLETAYPDVILAHNHAAYAADPSLITARTSTQDGLVLSMRFDSEENIWLNEVGLPDAQRFGGRWVDGVYGGAVSFARDGYLAVPRFESLFPQGSYLPMTIGIRMKKPGNNDVNVFLDTSYDTMRTEHRHGFALVSSGNNNLKMALERNGSWVSIDTGLTLSDELRTFIISIDPSGNYFATQDGILRGSGYLSDQIRFSPSFDTLWIGKKGDSTVSAAATIDELVIYHTNLSRLMAASISSRLGRRDVVEEGNSSLVMTDNHVVLRRGDEYLPKGTLIYMPLSDGASEIASGSQVAHAGGSVTPSGMRFTRDGTLEVMDFAQLFSSRYSPMTLAAVLSKPGYNDMNIIVDTSFDTFRTGTTGGFSILNSGTNHLQLGYERGGAWDKIDSLCHLLTTPRSYVFSIDPAGNFQSMMNGSIKRSANLGSLVPLNSAYDSLWVGGKGDGTVGYDGTIAELGVFQEMSIAQRVEISSRALGEGYLISGMPKSASLFGEYQSRKGKTLDLMAANDLEVSFNMSDLQIARLGSGIDIVVFDSSDISRYARYSIPKSSIRPGYNAFRQDARSPAEMTPGFSFVSSHLKVDVSQETVWAMDNPSFRKIDDLYIEFR